MLLIQLTISTLLGISNIWKILKAPFHIGSICKCRMNKQYVAIIQHRWILNMYNPSHQEMHTPVWSINPAWVLYALHQPILPLWRIRYKLYAPSVELLWIKWNCSHALAILFSFWSKSYLYGTHGTLRYLSPHCLDETATTTVRNNTLLACWKHQQDFQFWSRLI